MFWNKYPYTDMHELNLDWILAEIMKLHHDYDEFKAVNTITNAGAWDITKQYQAWTIVSDNNLGYISLKPVPAGVAITNTEYWGLIADYNILITDLSNRISTLEGQMVTVQGDITRLSNRYLIMIGDSYLAMSGSTIADDVANGLGLIKEQHAVASMGFVNAVAGETFIDLLDGVSATAKASADQIIVYGGLNDYAQAESDIYNAVDAFLTKVETDFPGVPCLIVGPQSTVAMITSIDLEKVHNAMQKACFDHGMPYADGRQFLNRTVYKLTDTYISDYTHPSAVGMKIIASCITGILKGSDNEINNPGVLRTLTSGDYIRYTVQRDGIEFQMGNTVSRTFSYGNEWLFEFFDVAPEIIPMGRSEVFDVYEMSDPDTVTNNRLGTAGLYRVPSYIRGLWIPSSSYTGYICVKGKIHFWDTFYKMS